VNSTVWVLVPHRDENTEKTLLRAIDGASEQYAAAGPAERASARQEYLDALRRFAELMNDAGLVVSGT